MKIILFDHNEWSSLLPLTSNRSVADCRLGIMTIKEKWEKWLKLKVYIATEKYLQPKYKLKYNRHDNCLWINSSYLPNKNFVKLISQLNLDQGIVHNNKVIVEYRNNNIPLGRKNCIVINEGLRQIKNPWDLFLLNESELKSDFNILTKDKTSQKIDGIEGDDSTRVFADPKAKIGKSFIKPNNGYIYIGENAVIMDGAMIFGSLALNNNSVLKMGAKIYGATTIGPYCKIGGEVNNSVIFGYSNKAHDGFIGNSVIGQWCNLGANTNISNLSNNYSKIKVWSVSKGEFIQSNQQFCGLIMADHSKTGINTMLNTGTVVGFSSNIFGAGFPSRFVPSFKWGGASGFVEYKIDKALETAKRVMNRRNHNLTKNKKKIFLWLYENKKNTA